jgi:3-phenylpropionate/trans-cinnamate dioxygenase ferredoxin reductase subunit
MRTVENAIHLKEVMERGPKKALVIGASMVGIKLVELFYEAGMNVCLADLAQHIFPTAAHLECARIIEERLKQKGIKLRLGSEIEIVKESPWGVKAFFKDSAESEEADLMVMCIGVKANTGFIERKQVAVDRGILVDGYMRTSAPGLFAAGDVAQGTNPLTGSTEIIGLWSNARYQGRTAGRNMAGKNEFFPGNIPHNMIHFMGMDFVGMGDVKDCDRMEKKFDGKRFIQLFWKNGFLTGANFLDSYIESGPIKYALMKGLRQKGHVLPGCLPILQEQLIKNILLEVERS